MQSAAIGRDCTWRSFVVSRAQNWLGRSFGREIAAEGPKVQPRGESEEYKAALRRICALDRHDGTSYTLKRVSEVGMRAAVQLLARGEGYPRPKSLVAALSAVARERCERIALVHIRDNLGTDYKDETLRGSSMWLQLAGSASLHKLTASHATSAVHGATLAGAACKCLENAAEDDCRKRCTPSPACERCNQPPAQTRSNHLSGQDGP